MTMMIPGALLLLFLLGGSQAQAAVMSYTDCGNGEVERITIEPCSVQPCHFEQGQLANVTVTFVSQQSAASVYVKSTLYRVGLFPFELQVPETDPSLCRNGDQQRDWGRVECPLQANKRYTFVYSRPFPVSTAYNVSQMEGSMQRSLINNHSHSHP